MKKIFNYDCPDSWSYYWHDLRKIPKIFSKRQQSGGSLIVWAAFGFGGKINVLFSSGRINALIYMTITCCFLLEQRVDISGCSSKTIHPFTWQIALGNVSWIMISYLMSWPCVYLDLNPMENVLGLLVRAVHSNGKQYASVSDIKSAIISHSEELNKTTVRYLIHCIPHHVFTLDTKIWYIHWLVSCILGQYSYHYATLQNW